MVCNHSIVGSMADDHRKPLKPMVAWHKNHRKTIEPNGFTITIPFNGDGAIENHWSLAMVAKCGPKSVDFVFSQQNGLGLWNDLRISFISFLYNQVHLSQDGICGDFEFFRSFEQAKTIVDHRTRIWGKPLKNHWCQWSICEKTFNGDGLVVSKPLKNHR